MMWLTPFLHLRCKAIFFTSLMTVLSWYNYDIKLTSCYRKVYEKNGYIMDKKELLKNTILSLDNDSFFELKTYFFKDFFGFYFCIARSECCGFYNNKQKEKNDS